MDYIVTRREMSEDELIHYGVLGMKWGKRSARPTSSIRSKYDSTKENYKVKKAAANDAFDAAYKRTSSIAITKASKKARDNAVNRYHNTEKQRDTARSEYKKAKTVRKEAIKSNAKTLEKKASFGEKLMYNSATRKRAAKYMVDNNMSVKQATKKAKGDAWRNTAAFIGAYGAIGLAAYKATK